MSNRQPGTRRIASGNIDAVMILLIVLMSFLFVSIARAQANVQSEFTHVGDTSHLEFRGLPSWNYHLRRVDEGGHSIVYLEVPPLDKTDLQNVKNWKSPLVESVEVVDGQSSIEKTVLAIKLLRSDVRSFDYQVDSPSQLIVDFFVQASPAEKKIVEKVPQVLPPKSQISKTAKIKKQQVIDRKPANDTPPLVASKEVDSAPKARMLDLNGGVFDGSDPSFERFAIKPWEIQPDAISASKQKVYLPWPMLQMPYVEIDDIVSSQPVYQVQIGESEENEQARFLIHLFEKKRYAAFLKAYKVFKKKFPTTKYNEILDYIYGDIHLSNFKNSNSNLDFETAINTYSELMVRYPKSPMFDRTAILVANAYLQKGELVRALRMFQKYLNDRQDTPHRDVVQLAMARAFAGLNQYDSATEMLIHISKNAQNPKYAMEARFRLGDAAFIQNKFEQAAKIYQQTLKDYPSEVGRFANIYFNLGEAHFWLGQHVDSLEAFRNQLRLFPMHPYNSYALTRLGELLDIMGADKKKSHAAFMESYFRYYPDPGAQVARVRMLTGRFKEMKPKDFKSAYKETLEIGEKDAIPGMNEFVTLAFTDALLMRGEYNDAIERLISYHQLHPTSLNLATFRSRIARILVEDIKSKIENGNFIEGLDKFEKHSTLWLKGVSRKDLKFYLARAFENAGVTGEAANRYQDLLIEMGKQGNEESPVDVFDRVPAQDQIYLRLARVNLELNQYSKTVEYLQKIPNEDKLTEPEKIERVELAARVFQKTGQNQQAVEMLSRLIETWKGEPELVSSPLLQKAQTLASMEKLDEAITALEQLVQVDEKTGKVGEKVMAQSLTYLGDWNLKAKKSDKAIDYYTKALEKHESSIPMPDVRYRLGQTYFDSGNLKEAEAVWEKLDEKNSRFWYQMAREQMKQDKFSASYKKYIDRIPAMADMPKEKSGGKL